MNNRTGLPSSLPPRPNFSTPAQAGPSQPRPQAQSQPQRNKRPQQTNQQPYPQSTPNPVFSPAPFGSQPQYTGGYPHYAQPQSSVGSYQPQYGMVTGYSQPNLSGGYPSAYSNPVMYQQPYPQQSYGQSLFQTQSPQQYNSGGYPYSTAYTHPSPSPTVHQPPNKKHRPNAASSQNDHLLQSLSGGPSNSDSTGTWRNCSHPGCKFLGPNEKVQIHEEDRHLIYAKGKMPERSEEEERFAKRKGPLPPIQGTNITLNTPEEIEKWIAERKAKWPSAKRLKEKEEETAAAIARGEHPGRGIGKGRKGGKLDAASLAEEWGRMDEPVELPSSTNSGRFQRGDRGRGRSRGRDGDRGRGRGRGRGGYNGSTRDGGDEGWNQITSLPSTVIPPDEVKTSVNGVEEKPNTNALSALGGYDTPTSASSSSSESSSSDSDSESESDSDSSSDTSSNDVGSEGGQQDQEEGKKEASHQEVPIPVAINNKPEQNTCKFFMRNRHCKFGDRCRNSHIIDGQVNPSNKTHHEEKKKLPQPTRQPILKKQNHFARPSMLGSLLSNPIQNTISQLSQTIRFLVANDMLDGVELKPGDAQEKEDDKNKVVQVDPSVSLIEEGE